MKRIVALAILAALLFTLCACGEVRQAEQAIEAIGSVGTESGRQIEAATAAVDALNEKQREKLENLSILEQAQSDYDAALARQAENQALVAEAERKIDEIGPVTLDSGTAIREAKDSYAAIAPEYQQDVTNHAVLEAAEAAYLEMAIQTVTEAIDAIGAVTLERAEAIEAARALYDSFPGAVQAQVANRDVLVQDEEALSALRVQNAMDQIAAIGDVTLSSGTLIAQAEAVCAMLSEQELANVENFARLAEARASYDALEAEAQRALEAEQARGLLLVTELALRPVDDGGWGVALRLRFRNVAEQDIVCIYYEVAAYGADGTALSMTDDEPFSRIVEGPFAAGQENGDESAFWLESDLSEVAELGLTALSVEFADGSVYTFNDNQLAAIQTP